MSVNRGLLNWGIFLIVLGAVPLAVQLDVIDGQLARDLLRLWPLILIGIGIGVLLRVTPLAPLGGMVVAATAGLLVGSVLAGGWGGGLPVAGCAGSNPNAALETRSAPFAGNRAELVLELSCVDLTVDGSGVEEWVVRADFAGDRLRLDSQPGRLALTDGGRAFLSDAPRRNVHVGLPVSPVVLADITLNAAAGRFAPGPAHVDGLTVTLNAADLDFELRQAQMRGGMDITLNASSAMLAVPDIGIAGGSGITLNASSLTLCVAPDVDIQITASETLSSNNFAEAGLTRSGDRWLYDGPGDGRLDLSYSANVSSITLDRSGGCQ